MQEQLRRKKRQDHLMTVICQGGAVFAVLLLLGFIGSVWINGFLNMTWKMLSFGPEGMGSMLFNTLYIVVLALVFSLITGLPAGVYLAEYARQGKLTRWVRMAIETLASLPSIVVGLFGYLAFIVMTHSQWNLLAGSLAVSVITPSKYIIPYAFGTCTPDRISKRFVSRPSSYAEPMYQLS